jgi:hypothetical protein
MFMRFALFWDITPRRIAFLYRRFGTTYRSHLQGQEVRKENKTGKTLSILCRRRRKMRRAGHVACMEENRGAYRILLRRPEERRPLGRPRRRWKNNIKMDLQELGWGTWTGLSWLKIGTGGRLL